MLWAARSPHVWNGNRRGRRSAESRPLLTPTVPLSHGRAPSALPRQQSRRSERRSCDKYRMARKVCVRTMVHFCISHARRPLPNTFSLLRLGHHVGQLCQCDESSGHPCRTQRLVLLSSSAHEQPSGSQPSRHPPTARTRGCARSSRLVPGFPGAQS